MELRYGTADENVRKRSIRDVILQERQKAERTAISEDACPPEGGQADPHAGHLTGNGRRTERKQAVRIQAEPSLLCPSRAGELAVVNAVNQLAEEGFRAKSFSPVILLPPGTQEGVLREMMHQICRTAFEQKIRIGQVHAEVTQAVNQPVIVGTAAGDRFCDGILRPEGILQEIQHRKEKDFPEKEREGWDIVLSGPVGLEGTCILVSERAGMLQERFPLSILARMDLPAKALCVSETVESVVSSMKAGEDRKSIRTGEGNTNTLPDPVIPAAVVSLGDGGFFTGLWRLADRTGCGLDVDLQAVPVPQETIEITNELGINPYAMRSAGSMLIAVQDGAGLVERLAEKGKTAVRIGKLTGGRDRILRNKEEIRYLDRPQTDALAQWLRDHPA